MAQLQLPLSNQRTGTDEDQSANMNGVEAPTNRLWTSHHAGKRHRAEGGMETAKSQLGHA